MRVGPVDDSATHIDDREFDGITGRARSDHACSEPIDLRECLDRRRVLADQRGLERLVWPSCGWTTQSDMAEA